MHNDKAVEILTKIDMLITMVRDVQIQQRQHSEQIARLEGKYDVMLAWLQSTDQRFEALMVPANIPKKAS